MNRLQLVALAALVVGGSLAAQPPEASKPLPEHDILKEFVGEWTSEVEAYPEPGTEPMKMKGTETGRTIGDFWAVIVAKGDFMGMPFEGQATIGYDPQKKKYVGSWVDSMVNHHWIYEGTLDASKKVLTLNSEGPSMTEPGKMCKGRDIWEFKDKDHRTLTSEIQGSDGKWTKVMMATYTRKK
jgi:hypothetical protein